MFKKGDIVVYHDHLKNRATGGQFELFFGCCFKVLEDCEVHGDSTIVLVDALFYVPHHADGYRNDDGTFGFYAYKLTKVDDNDPL